MSVYRKRVITRGIRLRQIWGYHWSALRRQAGWLIGRPPPRRFDLALCLCFKNASTYLEEWIDFHRLVGVEHFYLYNNNSEDDFLPVIAPYRAEGLVTLHEWPGLRQQLAIYDHCLRTHGPEARWIGFIDDDEFLFSPETDSVPEVLKDYEAQAGLQIAGLLFGTSGHVSRPPGGVLENFTACATDLQINGKCILRPEKAVGFLNPHHAVLRGNRVLVDENLTICPGKASPHPSARRLRINHYESKSEEELLLKIERGSASRGGRFPYGPGTRRGDRIAAANHARNYDIQRLLPHLQSARNSTLPDDRSGLENPRETG